MKRGNFWTFWEILGHFGSFWDILEGFGLIWVGFGTIGDVLGQIEDVEDAGT